MRRVLIVMTCLLVTALIAGTAATHWAGGQAEEQFRKNLDDLESAAGVELGTVDYQRGMMTSRASYSIHLSIGDTPLALRVEDRIHHGPLLLENGIGAGLATVSSRIFLPGMDNPAVTGTLHVDLRGQGTGRYLLDELDTVLTTDDARIRVMANNGNLDLAFDPRRQQLETRSRLESLSFAPADKDTSDAGAVFTDLRLHHDVTRVNPELWMGDGKLEIARVSVNIPENESALIEGLSVVGGSSPRNDSVIEGHVTMDMERFTSGPMRLGPGKARLTFHRFGIDALTAMRTLSRKMEETDEAAAANLLLSEGFNILQQFLDHGPVITLEELYLDVPDEGRLEAAASMAYPSDTPFNAYNPLAALNALKADVDVTLPFTVARHWLRQSATAELTAQQRKTGETLPDKELVRLRDRRVEDAFTGLLNNPMLRADNEQLRSSIQVEQGMVTINGTPQASLLNLLMSGGPPKTRLN